MAEFPHLKLPFKVEGRARPFKGGGAKNPESKARTQANKDNRQGHGQTLQSNVDTLLQKWETKKQSIIERGIQLPNTNDIPVFLKIDTSAFDLDSLTNWGIDLISEEEGGCIIGAAVDGLESFKDKISQFIGAQGKYKDTAAKIWEFEVDESRRINELLKGELSTIWGEIGNDTQYTVQLGISIYISNKNTYPVRETFDSEQAFLEKVNEFHEKERELNLIRDEKQRIREEEIERYLNIYGGTLHDIWDNGVDAVFFKLTIKGGGLIDLVQTNQYLYEVKLEPKYSIENISYPAPHNPNLEIYPPSEDKAKVCVIDSGIQENHILIAPAIDSAKSKSYLDGDTSTADFVKISGHGTKVAGAILYPYDIPNEGKIQLETFIQNARILDKNNEIAKSKFEPKLMQEIVTDFLPTRIYNLSVAEDTAYFNTHMPALAASLDKLIHENDILFIIASGNLYPDSNAPFSPGIIQLIRSGLNYPEYLEKRESKIANPGVSYFSLTVGSITHSEFEDIDYKSIAPKEQVSPFSRSGLGLWGSIKPDVVEFGGNLMKNKGSDEIITHESLSPELVNSTIHGANIIGKDSWGTSFSAPKVSYIASRLQTEHPTETAQMYRALIVQSARLPQHCFSNPTMNDFAFYGYGVPDLNRALNNTKSRITFIQNGKIGPKKADIYRLKIPAELRGEGRDFTLLAEVTLAFTARTRLTRKGSHSYLSNWLEWKSSKFNESFNSFRNRTIEYLDDNGDDAINDVDDAVDSIKWVIRENPAWTNNKINRNNSTIQKSWVEIAPQQFAEEFSIAVIGHMGWDKNLEVETPYSLCLSFEIINSDINIYNILAEAQVEVDIEQEIEL